MPELQVLLPGPWWHALSYRAEGVVPVGARVIVPLGRGTRVGICVGCAEGASSTPLKGIYRSLDTAPAIGCAYLHAAKIIAQAFLCSQSDVLRSLLPSAFWKGEAFPVFEEKADASAYWIDFCYRYADAERLQVWREKILSCTKGSLCIFPEREQAKSFYKSLVGIIPEERLIFWPASGGKAALKSWTKALSRDDVVVIGGPGSASAPMRDLRLVILDEESNPAWRTQRQPYFSLRSFAAARARLCGAQLICGGRMPSSRVFMNFAPPEPEVPDERVGTVRILDLGRAPRLSFRGIDFPLPLSDVLVKGTLAAVNDGGIVFWLLDRRGVTNELHCSDCGQTVLCNRCGSELVYEKGQLRCPVCGNREKVPDRCPLCGGMTLQGGSPGLESLFPVAQNLLKGFPVFLWHLDDPKTLTEGRKRISELRKRGGLILGSRRALSLLDLISPRLICWLNADAEARSPHYDSRFNAFSMSLESCWRSASPREIMFQTFHPRQPWMRALQEGWGYFWRREISERKALGFPPHAFLVEVELPEGWRWAEKLSDELDDAGLMVMQADPLGRKLSILVPKTAGLRHVLEPYFSIGHSHDGFPRIRVWTD